MNKPFSFALALGLGLALSGCANTLSGAKQDAATDTQKTQQAAADAAQQTQAAAQQAGAAIKAVPENAEANTVIRTDVKTAIISDPVLRDTRNLVNVNGHDHTITLTGHVADADMVKRATQDAQVVLKKYPDFKVVNELTVAGAQ
jgi:osmotically-inducible protein OsmY